MARAVKLYDFKDHPEHKKMLGPWRDRWITNAMSTKAMDDGERALCIRAVYGLYAAAKLPAPKHIVFVPSPFVLAFAGGFSSAIWHAAHAGWRTEAATEAATWAATEAATEAATWAATEAATEAATRAATWAATEAATRAATWAATRAATEAATRDATWAATRAATEAATEAATRDATRDATGTEKNKQIDLSNWYVVPGDMVALADALGVEAFGLQCAARAYNMWSGGNQWSGYDAYLSFFQDIAKLDIDYSGYQHWRTLAEHSGPRIMHPDFCMISDRPMTLTVDEQNRPHGENGPFCRWRDGTALYSWHGARVPAEWIEERATLDPNEVIKHDNVEVRAAGAALVGWPRMLSVLKAEVVDDSGSPDIGQLIELKLPGLSQPGRFLKARCPRNSLICEGVPRVDDFGLPIETASHAQAWRVGLHPSEYRHPEVRT
jgi:hypothetical protein